MAELVPAICEFLQRHHIQGAGLIAVSGGADSVALLRGLQFAGASICGVAHLNHQLRGQESDADEAFVVHLAEQLQLRVFVESLPVQQLASEQRINLEAAARSARYQFLRQTALGTGASWIATGHTANDQAETVLHRLIRGTGLAGLRGIAPVRQDQVPIIRPMIELQRQDMIRFLRELEQPYRQDSSNADSSFTRNRLRAEVLPLLESFNPDVVRSLSRVAEQAEETHAYLEQQMAQALSRCARPRAGKLIILEVQAFTELPALLRVGVMRQIYAAEQWPSGAMTAAHWKRLAGLIPGDYPDGIRLRVVGQVVQLGPSAG